MIKWQITRQDATWRQAAEGRAMTQALRDNVELRITAERQQSFQMLVSLYYPEENITWLHFSILINIDKAADIHGCFYSVSLKSPLRACSFLTTQAFGKNVRKPQGGLFLTHTVHESNFQYFK